MSGARGTRGAGGARSSGGRRLCRATWAAGRAGVATATEPFNSDLSRFAQGLASHLSAILSHRVGDRLAAIADWSAPGGPADATGAGSADSRTEAGVSAASSAAATGAGVHVPPPAPGYHDAKAFPELNVQRIPAEHCDAAAAQGGGMGGGADAGPSAEAGVSFRCRRGCRKLRRCSLRCGRGRRKLHRSSRRMGGGGAGLVP